MLSTQKAQVGQKAQCSTSGLGHQSSPKVASLLFVKTPSFTKKTTQLGRFFFSKLNTVTRTKEFSKMNTCWCNVHLHKKISA